MILQEVASKHQHPIKETSWCASELPVKSLLVNTSICKLLELIPPWLPETLFKDLSTCRLGDRARWPSPGKTVIVLKPIPFQCGRGRGRVQDRTWRQKVWGLHGVLQFWTHTGFWVGPALTASFQGHLRAMGTGSVSASILPYLGLSEKLHFVKAFSSFQHLNPWPSWAARGSLSWWSWHWSLSLGKSRSYQSSLTIIFPAKVRLGCLDLGFLRNRFQSKPLREWGSDLGFIMERHACFTMKLAYLKVNSSSLYCLSVSQASRNHLFSFL